MEDKRYKEKVRLSVYDATQDVSEHFHQDIEFLYVMEGKLDVTMEEKTIHMHPEDILVVNANKKHSVRGSENILYTQLTIEYHMVSDVFQSMNVIFWCDSTRDESERYDELREILKQLLNHHLSTGGNTASFGYISLCYQVLDKLAGYFLVQTADKENVEDNDKFDERIQQINNYIRAKFNQQISLKELSEKLFLSNGYLSRFFKRNYGMNFAEYLTNIRLFHAVDELLYSNKPITMIAYDNGFASVTVFNKAFKKAYGETPSALRKKSKAQKEKEKKPEQNMSKMQERLEKYLILNHASRQEEKPVEKVENRHSVKNYVKLKHCWGRTINMGMASDMLKSEIQEHVILLKEALGFEYVRFCNPFTKDMLLDLTLTEGQYNFTRLDSILDFLLRQGLKPHIEMGQKPRMISYNVQSSIIEGTRDVDFADADEWERMLQAMLRHLVQRYGRSEIDTWRMELWFNENKWDEQGSMRLYFHLFSILNRTVKQYSEKLEVGGCGVRADYQEAMRLRLYTEWKKQKYSPDFLSFIVYPYDRGEEKKDYYAKRCTDNECVKRRVAKEKKLIEQAGMNEIPLYITEWNLTASARNYMNDSNFKGAYILKNMMDIYGDVDDMAYWSGSDRVSEYYDSNKLLYGGIGVMTKDGILKPAGFAYEFMKRLYSYYVGKGDNYLISTDGHDSVGIVCHNQKPLGYHYYFAKEDEIEKKHLWKYFENRDELVLNLELTDLTDGEYQIKSYRINSENGSVLTLWEEMDYESELSRNDIKYFRRACEPKLTIQKQEAKNHVLKLDIAMHANEIVFVRVRMVV